MVHDVERTVGADARETTQADWVPPGRADLARRLDQMADKHPSSTRYDAGDRLRQTSGEDRTDRLDRPVADGRNRPGLLVPEIRGQRDLPDPDAMHTPPERARHILDGDAKGGGHRHGTGREGKTEFPKDWPDETALSMVMDVARKPDAAEWQFNGRWVVVGERDGVNVSVVVRPDGRICTAWPEPGGRAVIENPRT